MEREKLRLYLEQTPAWSAELLPVISLSLSLLRVPVLPRLMAALERRSV